MNINAEDLYQEMKNALNFFGLSFHQKEEMNVSVEGTCVVFRHEHVSIRIETEAKGEG